MGRSKWQNIHHEFHRKRSAAARAMKSHKSDIFDVRGRSAKIKMRVKKTRGRSKPWGPKYTGYQVQFKRKKRKGG